MQAIVFDAPGKPAEVLRLQTLPMPEPQPGEVRMKVRMASINPSDLMFVQNMYGIRPVFPTARAGFEAVGTVDACGEGVSVSVGARVSFTAIGTWGEYVTTSAKSLIPVPDAMPDEVATQLFVNPFTAYAMVLESGVRPGEYLMLSAAGSAFGKMVIQVCKMKGIKTIGTVRRPDLIEDLKALGADEIINVAVENPVKRVKEITEGKGVSCILEAVSGPAAAQLLPCLAQHGKMMIYGSLSVADIPLNAGLLIFKGISLSGFWLTDWVKNANPEHRKEVFGNVTKLLTDGTIQLPVEAVYDLRDIDKAVIHADREGRSGKILLRVS